METFQTWPLAVSMVADERQADTGVLQTKEGKYHERGTGVPKNQEHRAPEDKLLGLLLVAKTEGWCSAGDKAQHTPHDQEETILGEQCQAPNCVGSSKHSGACAQEAAHTHKASCQIPQLTQTPDFSTEQAWPDSPSLCTNPALLCNCRQSREVAGTTPNPPSSAAFYLVHTHPQHTLSSHHTCTWITDLKDSKVETTPEAITVIGQGLRGGRSESSTCSRFRLSSGTLNPFTEGPGSCRGLWSGGQKGAVKTNN